MNNILDFQNIKQKLFIFFLKNKIGSRLYNNLETEEGDILKIKYTNHGCGRHLRVEGEHTSTTKGFP
jgi:hypothetical protein